MQLRVRGIPTDEVDRIRRGGIDANGQPALLRPAEGLANPCRHCPPSRTSTSDRSSTASNVGSIAAREKNEHENVNDEHARHDEGRTEPRGAELRRHLQANSAAEIEK